MTNSIQAEQAEIIEPEADVQAIMLRPEPGSIAAGEKCAAMTPAQAKIDAIAHLTTSAYAKASTLDLSESEIEALKADFPDEAFQPGAAGKEHLIYIEHAWLRDRLNQVFRPGQWSIIPRNRWAEPFKTAQGKDGSRVYVEAMMVIRGCFAAEAIGEMEYYPHNASQNYGDAVEGAKTAALRRCCKEMGIGLQAWRKDFVEGWWNRRRGHKAPVNAPTTHSKPSPPTQTPSKPSQAAPAPFPTVDQREKMIKELKAEVGGTNRDLVTEYFRKAGALLPTENIEDLGLCFVPSMASQMRALGSALAAFGNGERAELAFPTHFEPEKKTTKKAPKQEELPTSDKVNTEGVRSWEDFPVPFGKSAGMRLGDVPKNSLFGFWANFEVKTEYNGKPLSKEKIAKDQAFRDMLDAAGEHHEFKKPEEEDSVPF